MIFASARRPLKDAHAEQLLFGVRALTGFALMMLVLLVLAGRYWWLQVVRHDDYTVRSESNRVAVQAVPPNRGLVYDRRGRPLAVNRPAYRLEVVPEKIGDPAALFDALAEFLPVDAEDRERFERVRNRYRVFDSVPVLFDLDEDAVARFAVNRHRFDGVDVVPYLARSYPYGPLLTHVLGYVGRLDEADLATVDERNYRGTTDIGKSGIERQYEDLLHGDVGVQRVETNAQGRVLRVLEREPPLHGSDLVLSIDVEVQQAAWDALGDRAGSVVAIDPQDGSVIAMVSKPAFDANDFVGGIGAAAYRAILEAPNRPLFNRALAGGYEPGSTLKPFVALAGLELGVIGRDRRIFSNGEFYLEGVSRPYRDWRDGGHGWVDVRIALEQSVNTYFYALARDLGIDRMHDYLARFGFGEPTGIDVPGEASGVLPSRDWKRARYNEPWYPGETVIAGIGQGFNVVTPLQLANATATLVNGGHRRQPRLLWADKSPEDERARRHTAPTAAEVGVVDPANWAAVREGMEQVVHAAAGTARRSFVGVEYRVGGKTGTAQVFGLAKGQEYVESEVAEHLRDHALFIAFAPVEAPRIALAVVVEHGGAGSRVAAPVARQVMDAWLGGAAPP